MLNQYSTSFGHPSAFRLSSITRLPGKHGKGVTNIATLFHEKFAPEVKWHSPNVDVRLKRSCYVAIRGLRPARQGHIDSIDCLELLDKPLATVNPFQMIPSNWVSDRGLVVRALALWELLSPPFQHLVGAIFWDGARFERFVTGPSVPTGQQVFPNPNLRHAIETAEQAIKLAQGMPQVSQSVLVAAALLHDAGKADDFSRCSGGNGYVYSERGALVGHCYTVLEWLAVARSKEGVVVPESQYLALVNALIASQAESRSGAQGSRTIEATLVAVADRVCMDADLASLGYSATSLLSRCATQVATR